MPKKKGWKLDSARHALAAKGVGTKILKTLRKPRIYLKKAATKPRITGTAHDWVELRFKGRNYWLTPKNDFIFSNKEDVYELWQAEMKMLKTLSMAQIRRKYKVKEMD